MLHPICLKFDQILREFQLSFSLSVFSLSLSSFCTFLFFPFYFFSSFFFLCFLPLSFCFSISFFSLPLLVIFFRKMFSFFFSVEVFTHLLETLCSSVEFIQQVALKCWIYHPYHQRKSKLFSFSTSLLNGSLRSLH